MRALSTMIVLVLCLSGTSLAGTPAPDMPGVGAFVYCGAPVVGPTPELMAQLGQ